MKLLIDDANIQKIKEISEFFPVDGVTTNPSILAKSGRPPFEVLSEIREFLGDKELHVQVISADAEGIMKKPQRSPKFSARTPLSRSPSPARV